MLTLAHTKSSPESSHHHHQPQKESAGSGAKGHKAVRATSRAKKQSPLLPGQCSWTHPEGSSCDPHGDSPVSWASPAGMLTPPPHAREPLTALQDASLLRPDRGQSPAEPGNLRKSSKSPPSHSHLTEEEILCGFSQVTHLRSGWVFMSGQDQILPSPQPLHGVRAPGFTSQFCPSGTQEHGLLLSFSGLQFSHGQTDSTLPPRDS